MCVCLVNIAYKQCKMHRMRKISRLWDPKIPLLLSWYTTLPWSPFRKKYFIVHKDFIKLRYCFVICIVNYRKGHSEKL